MLPPGSIIGLLGGGQLGRMLAVAAARLGYRVHVFDPDDGGPAAQVSAAHTRAPFDDEGALRAFAAAVDCVTLEWENVPVAALEVLQAAGVPVHPGPDVLRVTQDRLLEKQFANDLGLQTVPWRAITAPGQAEQALAALGGLGILKTTRLGYDGRGQIRVSHERGDAEAAFTSLGGGPAILEALIPLKAEVSVVLARGADGSIACYPPALNVHEDGILRTSTVPCALPGPLLTQAQQAASLLAQRLGMVGTMAVEFFVTVDDALLVNELAPRPHNSGHWTLDACACCQFEQQARAVCGLPLGPTTPHSGATMTNLLGQEAEAWPTLLADPTAILHLYGKGDARPGRKMGHVTRLQSPAPWA